MSHHPDADAFVHAILDNPAEVTTRLAFADWLEETGDPSNVAWAHFIRLSDEAARLPLAGERRREAERRLAKLDLQVRATLTVNAERLVGNVEHFWRLLPKSNLIVRLAGYEIQHAVIELVPESVARENFVLPLHLAGNCLTVVTTDPVNYDTIQKLTFILNKDITPLRADGEEILAAINWYYGPTETESVASVHYDMPIFTLDEEMVGDLYGLLVTAFDHGADGFELSPAGDVAELRLINPRRAPEQAAFYPLETHADLIRRLMNLTYTSEQRRPDRITREVEAPTVGDRIQRYRVEVNRASGDIVLVVHFQWA